MKELKVDKNHKRVDASKIGSPLKRISSGLLGTVMALSMYSGTVPKVAADEIQSDRSIVSYDEDETRELSLGTGTHLLAPSTKEPYTPQSVSDYKDSINVSFYSSGYDLTDLKYFKNASKIYFNYNDVFEQYDFIDSLPVMPSIESVNFMSTFGMEFTQEDADRLLEKFPNMKKLNLGDATYDPSIVENMTFLEELTINDAFNCDIDFTKLTFLKKIVFNVKPYNLAIFLNSNEYDTLIKNGVEIEFPEGTKETYLETSKKLDDIVESLGLSEDSTEKEKFDAVLIYILENYEYDPTVQKNTELGVRDDKLTSSFYKDGRLYAIFNEDTAICGNYTALFEALYDRLFPPKKSYFLYNEDHAWNLVNIGGTCYYVDSTWLDGEKITEQIEESYEEDGMLHTSISFETISSEEAIKMGKTDDLIWYMNDDADYDREYHVPMIMPSYMFSQDVEDEYVGHIEDVSSSKSSSEFVSEHEEVVDSSQKKVKLNINGKVIVCSFGALVGVMSAIGLAVHVNKKKQRELKRKRQLQAQLDDADYDYSGYDYSGYSSDYGQTETTSYGIDYGYYNDSSSGYKK